MISPGRPTIAQERHERRNVSSSPRPATDGRLQAILIAPWTTVVGCGKPGGFAGSGMQLAG